MLVNPTRHASGRLPGTLGWTVVHCDTLQTRVSTRSPSSSSGWTRPPAAASNGRSSGCSSTVAQRKRRVDVQPIVKQEGPAEAGHYIPLKNDGNRMSRIVRSPGGAVSTAEIELTVIDAVAISPCTPPAIFEKMRGDPSMSTESYGSGAPRYASSRRV